MVTEKRFKALEQRIAKLETAHKKTFMDKTSNNQSRALDILLMSHQIPLYARDIYAHYGEVSGEDLEKLKLYLEIIIDHFNLALPENLS